jgi:hypothetical protein
MWRRAAFAPVSFAAMWGTLATRAACGAALAGALGCAALPWPSGPMRPDEQVPAGAYYDLRGAVHVHTRASHDSKGDIGELIDAAHGAGLAFVALTEHPRQARFRPARGVVEGVILIPGWELGTAGGSILALGIEHRRGLVGGVDAHAKFRLLGPLGGTFDRYRDIFRLVTTHVLARDRSQKSILEALRSGRTYVAFEGLGLVEQFVAVREADGVHVLAPGEADLRLVCAGATVAGAEGREALLVPPPDAERCHVEAWLGSDLWVITSQLEPPVQ